MVIRYAIKLKNGGYMIQDVVPEAFKIDIRSTDLPIDADLLRNKKIAEDVIKEIIEGRTFIPVSYDSNNPPVEVVELKIDINIVQ